MGREVKPLPLRSVPAVSTLYGATFKVLLPQLVHCIHCDCKFVYQQAVAGSGGAAVTARHPTDEGAKNAAEQQAWEEFRAQLNDPELCKAVPCRECFRYQPYMAKLVGRLRYRKRGLLAALTILAGAVTVGFGLFTATMFPEERTILLRAILCGIFICVVGLISLRRVNAIVAGYDPNLESPDKRRSIAERHSMALDTFDELQASRARRAYIKHVAAVENERQGVPSAEKREPLIIDWWVVPSIFMAGGTVTFRITEGEHVTVVVPEDTEPYAVLEACVDSDSVMPFQVRVVPMRVHPDELRLE
jgi:hypothetical protein